MNQPPITNHLLLSRESKMSQRLRGISDEEATGIVKQVSDTSNRLPGRTASQGGKT